jgi:non-ribosomal peptide synthetase component F
MLSEALPMSFTVGNRSRNQRAPSLYRCHNPIVSTEMTKLVRSLSSGFLRSATRFSDRETLSIAGHRVSYQKLAERAKRFAATLKLARRLGKCHSLPRIRLSICDGHAAVLEALVAGRGYAPLNRTFPIDRTRLMLERSLCYTLIVDDLKHNWMKLLSAVTRPFRSKSLQKV